MKKYIPIITIALFIGGINFIPVLQEELKIFLDIVGIIAMVLLYVQLQPKKDPKNEKIKPGIITKDCFVCGTKNNVNRVYCRHCQTPIKQIICPICEHVNPYEQKYCEECDSILQNKRRY